MISYNYTAFNDDKINHKINSYLLYIINALKNEINFDEIKLVILTGSFGQEEGGVIFNKSQNVLEIINDIDIIIFPKKYLQFKFKYNSIITEFSHLIISKIPAKQVDINIGNSSKFFFRKFKLFYTANAHDTIHGSKILYGDSIPEKLKNKYINKNIPLSEGTKYLYTRGSGFLIPLYCLNNNKSNISFLDMFIEINKLKLCMGDSYLIYNEKYNHSYQNRYDIAKNKSFKQLPNGLKIKNNYLNALEWKLKPYEINDINIIVKEVEDLLPIYFSYFLWYENKRLNKKINSIKDYILFFHSQRSTIIDVISRRYYFKNNLIIMLIILDFYKSHKLNKEYIPIIKSIFPNILNKNKINWNKLVEDYLLLFHPTGIIKKVLS